MPWIYDLCVNLQNEIFIFFGHQTVLGALVWLDSLHEAYNEVYSHS